LEVIYNGLDGHPLIVDLAIPDTYGFYSNPSGLDLNSGLGNIWGYDIKNF